MLSRLQSLPIACNRKGEGRLVAKHDDETAPLGGRLAGQCFFNALHWRQLGPEHRFVDRRSLGIAAVCVLLPESISKIGRRNAAMPWAAECIFQNDNDEMARREILRHI
jgi:hypothetical protein